MPYTYSLPTSVSFTGKGLLGYSFGPLNQKDLEIYYIEVEKGHDTFMVSKRITRTYYVLSGSGYFVIDDKRYPVGAGVLVEVPPKVEYSYSGQMTLLGISIPRWFAGNDTFTKWNRMCSAPIRLAQQKVRPGGRDWSECGFLENRQSVPIFGLISGCGISSLRAFLTSLQYVYMAKSYTE